MKAILFSLIALLMVGCVRERTTDYYDNGQKKYERTWKGEGWMDQLLGGTRTGRSAANKLQERQEAWFSLSGMKRGRK